MKSGDGTRVAGGDPSQRHAQANAAAFDAFAADYDHHFSRTRLGQMLRARVWTMLDQQFRPGQHILELACGTGEDAVWLAQHGVRVTATDGSTEMLGVTRAKAGSAGMSERIAFAQLDLATLDPTFGENTAFDGAFSNFGGINVIGDWRPLAAFLAQRVRPGGRVVLVPMGRLCPWETGWHLAHLDLSIAARRFRGPAIAEIGNAHIPIWYPSARRLRRDFAPWFRHLHTTSLGLWLPPSYLAHLVDRWPGLFARLDRIETATARFSGGWGDHYIAVFERVAGAS